MALKGLDSEKHMAQGCCWKAPSQAVPLGHAHNSQHWTRAWRDRGDTGLPLRPLNLNPAYRGGHRHPWRGWPHPQLWVSLTRHIT